MRILIVSGYSVTENGKIQFDKYCDIIRRVFLNQKHLLDTETEFFTRDVSNLDDFLFDADCGYQSGDAARLFDFLDFIFIEMDASLRPWSKFSQKIMVLIRMCLRTNKILLASSGAMQALVFFVATNLETPVDVINGNQGCPLGDMTKIQKSVDQIKRNEYFLDNVTGDLYGIHFDQEQFKNCWVPIANGGIHYKKAAEEYNIVGKYMLKAPIYKPQGIKEIYGIFTSSQDEEILTIKKNRIQHPFFRDVKAEFLVHSKHSWDIHPFNVLNPRKVFEILAESPRGPQIIQVNHNIIGVQFTINPKYPETLILLRNFIVEHLIEIRSLLNKPQSIIIANNELRKNKLDLENLTQQQTELQNKGEKSKINFEVLTKFRHVGFAGKKNSKLEIVKNNAINDNGKLNQAMQTMKAKNSPRQNTENDQLSSKKSGLARLTTRLQEEQKTTDKFQKTAAEIRQMLHPNINDEGIPPDEPLWVPGNMSEHLKSRSMTKQPDQQQSMVRSVRPMTSQSRTFKLTRVSTAKSRVQPVVPGYDECRNKPIVRCSSPYITPLERDRQDERDADSKIIGPKTIRTSVVSTIKQLPPHHLYQNPYVSPGDFQFREIKKDKWLAEQNFILS